MGISHADPSLLEDALVDDAQNRKAVVAEANERTEERLACKQKLSRCARISESQRTHPHSLWCWILSLVVAGGSVVCGWCVHIVSAAQPISANAE